MRHEDLDDDMQRAVTAVLEQHGLDVTKYVLIAETRDPHSGAVPPALYIGTSNETPLWDSMGMLAYVAGMDHADIASRARLAEPR